MLRASNIVAATQGLLQDEPQRIALARRAAALQLADGIEIAMDALRALLPSGSRA
jgi:hypothetical protein